MAAGFARIRSAPLFVALGHAWPGRPALPPSEFPPHTGGAGGPATPSPASSLQGRGRRRVGAWLLGLAAASPAAQAGPWLRGPGELYAKLGDSRFRADRFVAPDGRPQPGATHTSHTAYFYAEIGLVEHLQAVVLLPAVAARNDFGEARTTQRGLGDAQVGLALGEELGGRLPVALLLSAKLPLYDNADLLAYGPSGSRFPALGDGQVDLTALVSAGSSLRLGPLPGWAALEAGYRHRSAWWMGDSSLPDRVLVDGIPWGVELGVSPRWLERELGWLQLRASGLFNLGPSDNTRAWAELSAGLGLRLARGLSFEMGAGSMFWGQNTALGHRLDAGLSLRI